jgi:hypothetical protein
MLELTVTMSPNRAWLRQFRAGVDALGERVSDIFDKLSFNLDGCLGLYSFSPEWRTVLSDKGSEGTFLCISEGHAHSFYRLKAGNYKEALNPFYVRSNGTYLPQTLALAFSSKDQNYKSECFTYDWYSTTDPLRPSPPARLETGGITTNARPESVGLSVNNRSLVVRIPIASVDLRRSEQVSVALLLPVAAASIQYKTDAFDGANSLNNVCEQYIYRRAMHQ